ncbi:amino acid transporter [Clostridium botulinum]|uniref:peptide MFS transporter n=1 Tax=Clostridium botulinum TaxID=1491 RepID=UPI00099B6349|nr:peptide MFS transporter [Clostridium botulinum]NFA96848.1 MFS transporter [Clostridium botulinum]NFB52511.1 MFS transporter [Clostridium botulinum]NFC77359.1 MFS transporter [Clostridium botulinum]NFC86173.1 MFS transporter [Clostridium botulinum]NFD03836.1 MFS transporter [Clostridium botulinum]
MSQEKQKHPIGLSLVNISIALQSYAGYAVSSVLILFFTADINRNGLGLSVPKAASIIGLYQGVNYMGSLVGGYITDKWLGIQKSLMLGSFLTACGYMVLFFAKPNIGSIWLGLIVLIIAGAFFKGQISTLVGSLYGKNELSKKDAAYSIFYMFINIGSFFGPIIAGLISDKWFAKVAADGEIAAYGYKYIFLMCAIVMIIVCALILILSPKWLGDVGKYPASKTEAKKASSKSEEKVTKKPLTHTEKNRIKAMLVMFLFVIIFWSAWYQTATSFSLLADKLVNRKFGGFTMPVPWLTSVNAIFCVVFSPILANIWVKLGNSKKGDLSVPTKMGLGLILAGASFITLILGISTLGGVTDGSRQMNILFIIVAYFLLTLGELCLSPIGMAMFNKLAPAKFGSLAMGAWYLSFFFSNLISGKLAGFTDTMGYTEIFGFIAGVVIIFGLILILLRKGLLRLMSLDEFNK